MPHLNEALAKLSEKSNDELIHTVCRKYGISISHVKLLLNLFKN